MLRPLAMGHALAMNTVSHAASPIVPAIVAGDFEAIGSAVAPDARLRYLIPDGPGEEHGAANVAARYRAWFGEVDAVHVLDSGTSDLVEGRGWLRYRLRVHEASQWSLVEQHVLVTTGEDGRIAGLDVICSGFQPAPAPDAGNGSRAGRHRFDAGTLSCGDGLAREFRSRICQIPAGDVLVVETADPAAREDLPSLARMMGHTVRSVRASGDGRLLITVERGR
jgi:TusA-related sulfurtransferase